MQPNDLTSGVASGIATLTSLRQPRLRLLANGVPVMGAISASITSNNHYAADRFRAKIHLSQTDAAGWSNISEALIDIQISIDGGRFSWTSLIQGEADHIRIDQMTSTLTIEGRDLTARLIETRTQETFANRTSSEIASLLAQRHSLAANVTSTSTPVGAYWQLEHDHITLDSFSRATTEWDLLVTLAGHEGFNVWISGQTLNFCPPQSNLMTGATLRPVRTASGPVNISSLSLERALTLARDIEVTVKSWNSRQATAFQQTARASRTASTNSGVKSPPLRYIVVVPNLTPDAALRLAHQKLVELSRHERVIIADMPGELSLSPRQQIALEGTNTAFDQTYWIDEITRRIDLHSGFTQHLRARNTSMTSQATSPADPIGMSWTAS